jgi:hypothetical protein
MMRPHDDSSFRVEIIKEFTDIEKLKPMWKSLQRHPNVDPDLFLLIAKHRKEILRPYIVVVCENDQPVSMAIGRIVDHHIECTIGYKSIFRPKLPLLMMLYGGYLGEQSERTARIIITQLLEALDRHEADAVFFNFLPTTSPLLAAANTVPGLLCRGHINIVNAHHEMTMPLKQEDFFKNMNRKHRSNMKKKAEKLESDFPGNVSCTFFKAVEEVGRLCDDAESIANKSYHRGLGVGFVHDAESAEMLHSIAEQDRLLSPVLYVNNKPVAFIIGELFHDRYFLNYMGYDAAYARYSTGIILFIKIMETLCDSHPETKCIDFGFGDADYKQRFSTGTWDESSVYIFSRRIRPVLINIVRLVILFVSQTLQGTLRKLALEARIKKILRKKAVENPTD